MKKFTFLLAAMLLACSTSVWAETYTLTAESGFQSSYANAEKTFDVTNSTGANPITIGYVACMYNAKNSPTGWGIKQLIQTRKHSSSSAGGDIYNTTAIYGLEKVIVKMQSNKDFSIYYGKESNPSENSLASSGITPTTESITYSDNNGAETTGNVNVYEFDLSDKDATYFLFDNGTSANYIYEIIIEYVEVVPSVASPVLTPEDGKVTDGNFTEAFTLTMSCATVGAEIYYTLDGTDPTESTTALEYTAAPITIPAKSTQVRAVAMGGEDAEFSRETAVTYCYINSAAAAYTVSEAIEVIDAELGLNNSLYVKGTIKEISEISTEYGNATYVITDSTKDLTVYRGYYLDGAKFTAEDQLSVGDEVVVYGTLVLYYETYEVGSGNQIISLKPATPSAIANTSVEQDLVKTIENGQLVIIREGVKYNAQGVKLN